MTEEDKRYFKREFRVLVYASTSYLCLLFIGWLIMGMAFFNNHFLAVIYFGLMWFFDKKI